MSVIRHASYLKKKKKSSHENDFYQRVEKTGPTSTFLFGQINDSTEINQKQLRTTENLLNIVFYSSVSTLNIQQTTIITNSTFITIATIFTTATLTVYALHLCTQQCLKLPVLCIKYLQTFTNMQTNLIKYQSVIQQ